MKYLITENRLNDVMFEFLKLNHPDIAIKDPLKIVKHTSRANSGWGSSMDDYIKITEYYVDEYDVPWFKHFDDRDTFEESKWEVSDELEGMFEMFGEENFENFVKDYFGIDITKKGNKKYNWLFR